MAERHLSAERQALLYRTARAYLEDHAAEPVTVDDAAAASGASVRELSRAFRWHAQTTPTRYLRRVRAASARDQLRDLPHAADAIARVAAAWRFPDARALDRACRRAFGVGPLDDA